MYSNHVQEVLNSKLNLKTKKRNKQESLSPNKTTFMQKWLSLLKRKVVSKNLLSCNPWIKNKKCSVVFFIIYLLYKKNLLRENTRNTGSMEKWSMKHLKQTEETEEPNEKT